MKTGFSTFWVPEYGADLAALREQHQRAFPGNELAFVNGYIKVAVLDGEDPPKGAVTSEQFFGEAKNVPPVTGNSPA